VYYLARWIADDSDPAETDIRPAVPEGASFAAIDLRGSSAAQSGTATGFALVDSVGEVWSEVPGKLWRIADEHKAKSRVLQRRMSNLLGFNFDESDVGRLLLEWYLNGNDANGGKPNELQVNRKRDSYSIHLGGKVLAEIPAVAGGAVMTDDFNRANGVIGSNWTKVSNDSNPVFTITSNQLAVQGRRGVAYYTYNDGTSASDAQYCEIEVADLGYNQFAPQVRMLNSYANGSGYQAYWEGHAANRARIRYTNTAAAPGRTTLTSDTNATGVADLPLIRIEVDGSALSWWHDGAELTGIATTDTTYPGASTRRSGGLYLFEPDSHIDNWAFGDLANPPVEIEGEVPTAVSLVAPEPEVVRVFEGGEAVGTTTPEGTLVIVKILAGGEDIAITTELVAPAPGREVNLAGDTIMATNSFSAELEVETAALGGPIETEVELTGPIALLNRIGGEISLTSSSLTGKLAATALARAGEEAGVEVFATLTGGPLKRTARLVGEVDSEARVTFGEPTTLAKMWNGTAWTSVWINVQVVGTFKRGQLRIWNGTQWLG